MSTYEASRAPAPSFVTMPPAVDPPPTVLDFLERRFPRVARKVWEERVAAGWVTFDGDEPVEASTAYRANARLRYYRAVTEEPVVPFKEEILHRDEHLLVADKPHFLPVTPGGPYVNECLLYRLRKSTGLSELRPIHRLDRATAGLVMFALSREAGAAYGRLFKDGEMEKRYLAVARLDHRPDHKVSPGQTWTVENRLVRGEPWFRMKMEQGEANASTSIELLEVGRGNDGAGMGLFRLAPKTGKTHQLRVHLASLGFPIVGDRYYPELTPERPPDFSCPLRLLAQELRFKDPLRGREVCFRSRMELDGPSGS